MQEHGKESEGQPGPGQLQLEGVKSAPEERRALPAQAPTVPGSPNALNEGTLSRKRPEGPQICVPIRDQTTMNHPGKLGQLSEAFQD